MSGLRHVQFYDNDTLLWSNNSNYSPASSQFVIALFSQGLSIIDYIAHTSVSIFYSTFPLSQRPHLKPSQQSASELRAAAERPLFAHRYERESLRLRHDLQLHPRLRSLPQLPIPPPLQSPRRRLPRPFLLSLPHSQNYQRASSEIQVVALNSQNLAICWTLALDASNEFLSLSPDFAFANGGLCPTAIRSAAFSADLRRLLLTDGARLIALDVGVSREGVSLPELTGLGVRQALPAAALRSVAITGGAVLELAAPLVPALPAQFVPVVDGRNSLAVVDLRSGAMHRLSEPSLLGSAVQGAEFRHVALRVSDHSKVGAREGCEGRSRWDRRWECSCSRWPRSERPRCCA